MIRLSNVYPTKVCLLLVSNDPAAGMVSLDTGIVESRTTHFNGRVLVVMTRISLGL